jgi:hypothetical protein
MKFIITYTPHDGEPREWPFDPDEIDNTDAELIELCGGELWDSYDEWLYMMGRGNMRSYRAILWMLLRRTNPGLEFDAVKFRRSDLTARIMDDEPAESGKGEGDDVTDSPPPTSD